jgi:phosphate transport system substrate-binding protein
VLEFFPRKLAAATIVAAVIGISGCRSSNSGAEGVMLSGAGSTFVYPVMTRWIEDYSQGHPNVRVNYQSIGSGGGIQQVKMGTVDFGASDAALNDEQLKEMKPVIQIPESAGPVCITYNLPDLKQPLQLSPQALAAIFLGTIKSWQDPAITKDNPGIQMPKLPVIVAHRADGSGTTNIFTTYLAAVSPEWQSKVGKGNSVNWPVGLGGKGSEGVTGNIRQSPGTIGYVELTYAEQNHLPVAKIKNQAGQYVSPTAEAATSAINAFSAQLAQDPRTPIVDPPASAKDAYPISGLTFLIIPKDGADKVKRSALKGFVQYIITDGQATAGSLHYAPLPDGVKQYDQQQLQQMTANGLPLQ